MKTIIKPLALLFSIGCIYQQSLYAASKDDNSRNPTGCKDVGYEFNLKTLHLLPGKDGSSQAMYFMYNSSEQTVTLYQMRYEDSSRSMYMNHAINANQWAVLSTTERNMSYICTVPDENLAYGKIVDCAQHLRICEYTNVRYGLNNRGNFWLVNSNSRNAAVNQVVRYGIIPGV